MASKTKPCKEPTAQRKRTCKDRYGKNAAGKWVRKSAFREIDYDPDAPDKLREFNTFDDAFAFDEERRLDGTGGRHAKPYPKAKDSVPKEQLALEKAITHVIAADGNETRVQLQRVEEGLHERHDEGQALLQEIRAHQLQESQEQKHILDKKEKLIDKQKEKNEAFVSRIEQGNGTDVEQKKLQIKILQEEVRQHESRKRLENARQKAIAANRRQGKICGICTTVEIDMTQLGQNWLCSKCEGPVQEKPHIKNRAAKPSNDIVGKICLLYTSPSPRDRQKSRMPASA